jgi:hypothetical protein
MDARNGWSVLTKADEIATLLRVYHLQDQPLNQLSGGEHKGVAIRSQTVGEWRCAVPIQQGQVEGRIGVDAATTLGPRATKSKARIDAFYKLDKATEPRPLDPNLALGPKQRRQGQMGDMLNLERATEKLKQKSEDLQSEIDKTSSNKAWTVLAELTDKLNGLNEEIDEKETWWMELAEELEVVEVEL